MNVYAHIIDLMVRFERANNTVPNCIVLGFDAFDAFQMEVARVNSVLKSDPEMRGTGIFFRGCRVLKTDSPGVWVGRMVEPIKHFPT